MRHDTGIRSKTARAAKKARAEPYWDSLEPCLSLGFRKMCTKDASGKQLAGVPSGSETWVGRFTRPDGTKAYKPIGRVTERLDYEAAKAAVRAWYKELDAGIDVDGTPITVEQACKNYVADLTERSGAKEGKRVDVVFVREIYDTALGRKAIKKVDRHEFQTWLRTRGVKGQSANRYWTSLSAALTLAVEQKKVSAERRVEWMTVKRHKNPNNKKKIAGDRREVVLTLAQRKKLIEVSADTPIGDFIAAMIYTGARPHELAAATRRDLDADNARLKLCSGKTGERVIGLWPSALTLFKRLARRSIDPKALLLIKRHTDDEGEVGWLSGNGWNRHFNQMVKKAGLPLNTKAKEGVSAYTLRHSFCTAASQSKPQGAGMSAADLAAYVGTSVQQITDHYYHTDADRIAEHIASVAEVFA